MLDKGCAEEDEYETHHNGAKDTPEQDLLIVPFINPKGHKDQDHHKYIVHRQSIFDDISGQVLQSKIYVVNPDCFDKSQSTYIYIVLVPGNLFLELFQCADIMNQVTVETQENIKSKCK